MEMISLVRESDMATSMEMIRYNTIQYNTVHDGHAMDM